MRYHLLFCKKSPDSRQLARGVCYQGASTITMFWDKPVCSG